MTFYYRVKFQAFADDKLNVAKIMLSVSYQIDNIVKTWDCVVKS